MASYDVVSEVIHVALSTGACPVGLSCFLSAAVVAAAGGGNGRKFALHASAVAGVCVSRSAAVTEAVEWAAHDAFSEARGVAALPPPQTCSVSRCGPGARPLLCAAGLTCVVRAYSTSGYGSCVHLSAGEGIAAGTTVLSEYTDTAGVVCKSAVCVRSVGGACGVTTGGACGAGLLCTPVRAGNWEGPARCLDARAAPGATARQLMVAAAIGVFSNRSRSYDDVCGGGNSTNTASEYSLRLRGTLNGAARVTTSGRAWQILLVTSAKNAFEALRFQWLPKKWRAIYICQAFAGGGASTAIHGQGLADIPRHVIGTHSEPSFL
jgi:hypothetical protein